MIRNYCLLNFIAFPFWIISSYWNAIYFINKKVAGKNYYVMVLVRNYLFLLLCICNILFINDFSGAVKWLDLSFSIYFIIVTTICLLRIISTDYYFYEGIFKLIQVICIICWILGSVLFILFAAGTLEAGSKLIADVDFIILLEIPVVVTMMVEQFYKYCNFDEYEVYFSYKKINYWMENIAAALWIASIFIETVNNYNFIFNYIAKFSIAFITIVMNLINWNGNVYSYNNYYTRIFAVRLLAYN